MIDARVNIGNKFNEDGSVRFFPGNSIVSMLDHEAEAWRVFCGIRQKLQEYPVARCLTFLPDESIHMTVFEGVCHQWREKEVWTRFLPIDCTLTETDELFERELKKVQPLGTVTMRLDEMGVWDYGVNIPLFPATEKDAQELRRYRDDCSQALGIRHAIHDTYRHHLSMGYFVADGTDEDEQQLKAFAQRVTEWLREHPVTFTVQQPKLTFFNDMFFFHPNRIERNGL